MTRLASILGVATVATLVLLSGCEAAVTTDYAKDLAGSWEVTIPRTLTTPTTPPTMVPVMTLVAAEIARTGTNKGTVMLTITDSPAVTPGPVEVTGNIEVTATVITVSGIMVEPMLVLAAIPGGAELITQDQPLTYDRSDDGSELTVSNAALFTALLGATEITLTKQMASPASR